MPVARYTSRVFVALEAVFTKIDAATFTANPNSNTAVIKTIGASDPEFGADKICVRLNLDSPSNIEWRRLSPPGADEEIFIDIVVQSFVPATATPADMLNRLETMTDEVMAVFFNTSTNAVVPLGYAGEEGTGRVVSVVPEVAPVKDHGWIGQCVITYRTRAQI